MFGGKEEQLVSHPDMDRNPCPLYFIIISFLERFIVRENYLESIDNNEGHTVMMPAGM